VFASKNCNFLSAKNKFSAPRIQSRWNSTAILSPFIGVFHRQMPDNVSFAHFIDFLCGVKETVILQQRAQCRHCAAELRGKRGFAVQDIQQIGSGEWQITIQSGR